eukprot:SAG31_NODE_357_length_17115_cov_64.211801_4_plen_1473_part_00
MKISQTTAVVETRITVSGVLASLVGRPVVQPKQFAHVSGVNVRRYAKILHSSEEHVLYCASLPTFDDYCTQEEAEQLLSTLTAPLMRIPLLLTYFTTSDRASQLFHPVLRSILRAALLSPFQIESSTNWPETANVIPLPTGDLRTPWSVLAYEIEHGAHNVAIFDDLLRQILCIAAQSDIHCLAAFEGTLEMLSLGVQIEEYCAAIAENGNAEIKNLQSRLSSTLLTQGLPLLQIWLGQATKLSKVLPMMQCCVCIADILSSDGHDTLVSQSRLFLSCSAFAVVQFQAMDFGSASVYTSVGISRLLVLLRATASRLEAKYCASELDSSSVLAQELSAIVHFATGGNECQKISGWHQVTNLPSLFCENTGRVTFDLRTASINVLGQSMKPLPALVRTHLDLHDCNVSLGTSATLCSILPAEDNVETAIQVTMNRTQYVVRLHTDDIQLEPLEPTVSMNSSPDREVMCFDGVEWMLSPDGSHSVLEQFKERWAGDCEVSIWTPIESHFNEKTVQRVLIQLSNNRFVLDKSRPSWREAYVYGGNSPRMDVYSIHTGPPWVGAVRWPVYTSDARRSLFKLPNSEKGYLEQQAGAEYMTGGPIFSKCLTFLEFEAGHPLGLIRYNVHANDYRIESTPCATPMICEDCWRTDHVEVSSSHGTDGKWRWCTACAIKHAEAQQMANGALLSIFRICGDTGADMLWVPTWQLVGVLPAFLVEKFNFWRSVAEVGILHGEPRQPTRWSSYCLRVEIEPSSCKAAVFRIDDTQDKELVLLDATKAVSGLSLTAFIADKFAQLEELSHVLFWADSADPNKNIVLVELPRLGTAFVRRSDKLYSIDNLNFFISTTYDKLVLDLIGDLPSFLLLEEVCSGQLRMMVSNAKIQPSKISVSQPFPTSLKLIRGKEWCEECSQRFFQYPLHPLHHQFDVTNLASSLYLFMLRLLGRDYANASALVTACASDKRMTGIEKWIFDMVALSVKDMHPEASACRIMLFEATLLHGLEEPPKGWDIVSDMSRYCASISHVRPNLRIEPQVLLPVVNWALRHGEPAHPLKRTASWQRGHVPTPQSVRVSVLQLFERQLRTGTSEKHNDNRSAEHYHGGGGWNRLESQVGSFFNSDKWTEGDFMPMRLKRPPTLQDHEKFDALALFTSDNFWESADSCLLFVYELLRGKLKPRSGSGKAWSQLMALSIYLHRQPLQGTLFWEETSHHLLAAMAFNPCFDQGEDFEVSQVPEPEPDAESDMDDSLVLQLLPDDAEPQTSAVFPDIAKSRFKNAIITIGGGPKPPEWAQMWFAKLQEMCCANSQAWKSRIAQDALARPPQLSGSVFTARIYPGRSISCEHRVLAMPSSNDAFSIPQKEIRKLAMQPLDYSVWLVSASTMNVANRTTSHNTADALPYILSKGHPDAQDNRAQSFLQRADADAKVYDNQVRAALDSELTLKGIDWNFINHDWGQHHPKSECFDATLKNVSDLWAHAFRKI